MWYTFNGRSIGSWPCSYTNVDIAKAGASFVPSPAMKQSFFDMIFFEFRLSSGKQLM
jgi:hypothetical protein